jgi:hypothetical protein
MLSFLIVGKEDVNYGRYHGYTVFQSRAGWEKDGSG